jgi:hypothetical protein
VAQQSRLLGYVLIVIALIASAVALVFGYFGAKLIYLAATFGGDAAPLDRGVPMVLGILSYISVLTAATLFPLIAVVAAAIAWVCWRAGRSQI